MPVADGPIIPLIGGQAVVRVQDIDTTALTADTVPAVNSTGGSTTVNGRARLAKIATNAGWIDGDIGTVT